MSYLVKRCKGLFWVTDIKMVPLGQQSNYPYSSLCEPIATKRTILFSITKYTARVSPVTLILKWPFHFPDSPWLRSVGFCGFFTNFSKVAIAFFLVALGNLAKSFSNRFERMYCILECLQMRNKVFASFEWTRKVPSFVFCLCLLKDAFEVWGGAVLVSR